jgi:hypothetical protein
MPPDQVDLQLWRGFMRSGDFEAAWRVSDRRPDRDLGRLPRHLRPLWSGTALGGAHVLVHCYRGLGDTINFIRYAESIKTLAKTLTVAAQPALIPLLRTMRSIDRIIALDAPVAFKREPYVEIEVTELPYAFRTSVKTIPAPIPYFHVPRAPLLRGSELAIGLVWTAGNWDPRRSISLTELSGLRKIPGVKLYSFQCGAARAARCSGLAVARWRGIVHEAALLRDLDLLISVDTMPAHLAGALGVPVWVMLHADPDWRWLESRSDSPWYPTMRLFRQQRPGEWRPVVRAIDSALRALSCTSPRKHAHATESRSAGRSA